MMDCKKALATATETLQEGQNLMELSLDILRKQGSKQAAKKAGRTAVEGLIGVIIQNNKATMLEVNSETDFVARNELFHKFIEEGVQVASNLDKVGVEELLVAKSLDGKQTVADSLVDVINAIRENIQISRVVRLEPPAGGLVEAYVHQPVEGYKSDTVRLGRIGSMVALDKSGPELQKFGSELAMHVAAASPRFLDQASVPQATLDKESAFLTEQARESGKPENMIEKIVKGQLAKFYGDNCLVNQAFVVHDGEGKPPPVQDVAKKLGTTITAFYRFQCGAR